MRVHGALLLTAVLFSANYIISKLAMREIEPFAFAWLRVLGAWLLLSLMLVGQTDPPLTRRQLRLCALYSILGVVVNQLMFLGGLARTSAHEAALLITTIPVFVLAAAATLRYERVTAWKVGGIGLALAGALIIVLQSGRTHTAGSLTGNAMIIVNCLSYALYLVLSRHLFAEVRAVRALRSMFGFGMLFILPFSAAPLASTDWSSVRPVSWVWLAAVIAGPTVGAYALNGWALGRAQSSTVAIYTYLQPVMATVMAAAVLGERVGAVVAAGGALIVAGVAVGTRRRVLAG